MHFFDNRENWEKGISWYGDLFRHPELLQGEKTPNYLPNHEAHERMASTVPHAKLIVCLRNPVDRAYSAWNHFNQAIEFSSKWGWQKQTFEKALSGKKKVNKSLIGNGLYAKHLRNLFSYYPREQVHIIISERMRADPTTEYHKTLDFLGLSNQEWSFKKSHKRKYTEKMDIEIRRKLGNYFAPFNEDLFSLLGEDIPEWIHGNSNFVRKFFGRFNRRWRG